MAKRDALESAEELSAAAPSSLSANVGVVGVGHNGGTASGAATPTGSVTSSTANTSNSTNAPPSVSAVWAYFDKDAMGNSVCKFCDRVIKGHHSSNLLSHLRTAGRTDGAHQQASAVCEEHRETKRTVKRQKMAMPTAAEFAASYPHLVAAAAAAAVPGFASPFAAGLKRDAAYPTSVTALAAAAAAAATLSKDHRGDAAHANVITPGQVACSAEQLAQDFALMVLTENLPMNFSSQPGFQNFAHLLLADKKSLLPDEDAVAKNILMLQQSLALTTKMLLARTRGVAISLEAWKHPSPELSATAKYLAVSAHFSINFRPYHVTLSCSPVGSGLDLASLKANVEQTLERAGIKDKVVACIVGDLPWKDGEQMTLSDSDLPSVFASPGLDGRLLSSEGSHATHVVPCAATLLRASVKKSVFADSFPHHVLAVDDLFRRFAQQPDAHSTLKRKCPLIDPTVVVDDEAYTTGARSYYDVLRDVHDSLATLEQIAQEFGVEFLSTASVEWVTMVTKKLRPFARYADAFEAEKQKRNGSDKELFRDGSSSVSTIAAFLVEHVEKQATQGASDGAVFTDATEMLAWKSFYLLLAKDLRERFAHLSPHSLAATLLDPRYKDRDCCYLEPAMERVEAEELLRRLLEIPTDGGQAPQVTADSSDGKDNNHTATASEEDEDDDLLAQLPSTGSKDAAGREGELASTWTNELTAFLSLPLAERHVDPMAWWKVHQLRFPLLAPLAELLLALPAAATSGESTLRRINQTLLRVEGFALDPTIATTPALVDAFLSFQKNRENVIEWFRSNSTVLADPVALSEMETAAGFKHVENV